MDSITESSKISKTFHAEFLGISDKAEQNWKETQKTTGLSWQTWKGFAVTPREEKRLYNGQL